ncbi:MAG: ABC transporter substrate-binding protein [Clostridia bacterium]|nr:ABC transporter substrate-binding protein [Clostridia bacterium]MBR6965767.1 ABC transporter substrate-binding protein [Clostridia bacterium]
MSTKARNIIIAVVALAIIAVAAWLIFGNKPAEKPAVDTGDAIVLKIAHIGPLTGPAAVYGNATSNGGQIAADEINAAGGKFRIEYKTYDDTHDAEIALNCYNKAMDDGAQMIVGTTTTSPCIAVSAQAAKDRTFMLTPSASSTEVTKDKDNMYQVCFTDPAQGTASAEYIAQNKLPTKIAVIYNNADAYSTGIYQTFVEKAKELNLEIVSETAFQDSTKDFTVQVNDAKNAGAELVFLPIYYGPASMILQTAAQIDYKPIWFGVDGMDGILDIEGFDKSLAEGVLLLTPFSADAKDEKTQKFVATYKEKYGGIPNQFAADAYDAVYALTAAAEKAGITADMKAADACDKLIAAMQEIKVEGVTGTMTWSSSGEVTKTPTAVVIKNGVYVGFNN